MVAGRVNNNESSEFCGTQILVVSVLPDRDPQNSRTAGAILIKFWLQILLIPASTSSYWSRETSQALGRKQADKIKLVCQFETHPTARMK